MNNQLEPYDLDIPAWKRTEFLRDIYDTKIRQFLILVHLMKKILYEKSLSCIFCNNAVGSFPKYLALKVEPSIDIQSNPFKSQLAICQTGHWNVTVQNVKYFLLKAGGGWKQHFKPRSLASLNTKIPQPLEKNH